VTIDSNVIQLKPDESNDNEIESTLQRVDNFLKTLSVLQLKRSDSRLVFANELIEMTNITIDKKSCSEQFGRDLLLVVLVFNRVDGFERRQTIRQTWGQEFKANKMTRIYFAVGLSRDPSIESRLKTESDQFDDILQFGYYENYYNCTIKALALLRWTARSCPFAKYMLKVDDDSLVMANNLLDFIRTSDANAIYGYLWTKAAVDHSNDKWGISTRDFSHKYYPDYIGGPYLIPVRYCLSLYETAVTKYLPALPFEDAYVTGIVANHCKINRNKLVSLLYITDGCNPLALDFCHYKSVSIFWQNLTDNSIRKLWNIYHNVNVCSLLGGKRCA